MAYARWARVLLVMNVKTKTVCFLGSENCNELNRVDALGYHFDFLEPQPGTLGIPSLSLIFRTTVRNLTKPCSKLLFRRCLETSRKHSKFTMQILFRQFSKVILSDSTSAPDEFIWMVF